MPYACHQLQWHQQCPANALLKINISPNSDCQRPALMIRKVRIKESERQLLVSPIIWGEKKKKIG